MTVWLLIKVIGAAIGLSLGGYVCTRIFPPKRRPADDAD